MGMSYDDLEQALLRQGRESVLLKQELEHERYNVEKTAQEGARRLKEAAAEHTKLLSAFNEAEGTILNLDHALREAREQLIRLRDGGAEHPETQRIIDKIWHLTNFDGYPPAHEQWGDGVAECQDWSNK